MNFSRYTILLLTTILCSSRLFAEQNPSPFPVKNGDLVIGYVWASNQDPVSGLKLSETARSRIGGKNDSVEVVGLYPPATTVRLEGGVGDLKISDEFNELFTKSIIFFDEAGKQFTVGREVKTAQIQGNNKRNFGIRAGKGVLLDRRDAFYGPNSKVSMMSILDGHRNDPIINVEYPRVPEEFNGNNTSGMGIRDAYFDGNGDVKILWSFRSEDLSGKGQYWYLSTYGVSDGKELNRKAIANSLQNNAMRFLSGNGKGMALFKVGLADYQLINLEGGNSAIFSSKFEPPKFVGDSEMVSHVEKGISSAREIVVADDKGKIISKRKETVQKVLVRKLGGPGNELKQVDIPGASWLGNKIVWFQSPYALIEAENGTLLVNVEKDKVLGAIEGGVVAKAKLDGNVIRVAVIPSDPRAKGAFFIYHIEAE